MMKLTVEYEDNELKYTLSLPQLLSLLNRLYGAKITEDDLHKAVMEVHRNV